MLKTITTGMKALVNQKLEDCKRDGSSSDWVTFLNVLKPLSKTFEDLAPLVEPSS